MRGSDSIVGPAAAPRSQVGKEGGEAADPQQPVTVVPPVRLVLSSELLRVFDNLKEVLSDAKAMPDTAPGGPFAGWPGGMPYQRAFVLHPGRAPGLLNQLF